MSSPFVVAEDKESEPALSVNGSPLISQKNKVLLSSMILYPDKGQPREFMSYIDEIFFLII